MILTFLFIIEKKAMINKLFMFIPFISSYKEEMHFLDIISFLPCWLETWENDIKLYNTAKSTRVGRSD